MALETSAQLLAYCKFKAARPTVDKEVSDTQWYILLSLAQEAWYGTFAQIFPAILYGDPTKMVTSDNKVFTFADSVFPIGEVEIRDGRNGELLLPTVEWSEQGDFVPEGSQIRIPGNRTRTFTDGPYARYITPAGDIDADTEPTLVPAFARVLIACEALIEFAERGYGQRDPDFFKELKQRHWEGDPQIAGSGILATLEGQYFGSGAAASENSVGPWYRSSDLG